MSCCHICPLSWTNICLIKSMHTDAINHDPGKTLISTGSEIPGKPSLGAWLSYGLGSLNKNLPDFMVLNSAFWSGDKRNVQALYSRLWGTGFLPSKHQGVLLQPSGDPVLFLSNPAGVSRASRHKMLDLVTQLNNKHSLEIGDPEIQTTIAQQEMAFRMQASVPELTDIRDEPQHILDLYGPEVEKSGSFARNCLLARRMAERDVRFVQLYHRGWDHHAGLPPKNEGHNVTMSINLAAGTAEGSQAKITAGRYTGCIRWRVWPYGLLPGQTERNRLRSRPSPQVLYGVDRRWWHQRWHRTRPDG